MIRQENWKPTSAGSRHDYLHVQDAFVIGSELQSYIPYFDAASFRGACDNSTKVVELGASYR